MSRSELMRRIWDARRSPAAFSEAIGNRTFAIDENIRCESQINTRNTHRESRLPEERPLNSDNKYALLIEITFIANKCVNKLGLLTQFDT